MSMTALKSELYVNVL